MNDIATERLTLRAFKPSDADDLHAYLSDEETVRFEPYKPFSREQSEAEAARRAKDESFIAVCLDGRVIGNIYMALENEQSGTWELGYVFNRAYWGKGYASEAAKAVVDNAFTRRGASKVIAMCNPINTASWRLMERLGMKRVQELKHNVYFFLDDSGEPIWLDTYIYELTRGEWEVLQNNSN